MDIIDYIIPAHGVIERKKVYDYFHKLGYKDCLERDYMIQSLYPFGICIKKKHLLVIESATNCFMMQKSGRLKSIEEIQEILGEKNERRFLRLFNRNR